MKTAEEPFPDQAGCRAIHPSLPTLDPTWTTVTTVFPGQTGRNLLRALLASAVRVQENAPDGESVEIAVLHCQSLATFAHQVRCGKDTLLRYVKLYQALGLLTHTRVSRQGRSFTQVSLPLTPYQPSFAALERVHALTTEGRKKQQDLARFVYEQYRLVYALHPETGAGGDPVLSLLRSASSLLQKKRVSRIERQVLQQTIAEVLLHLEGHQQGDPQGSNDAAVSLHHPQRGDLRDPQAPYGDPMRTEGVGEEDVRDQRGDLFPFREEHPEDLSRQSRDLTSRRGDLPFSEVRQSEDLRPKGGDLRTGTAVQPRDQGDFSAQKSDDVAVVGDQQVSDACPSSIDVFSLKDSSPKGFELESNADEQWTGNEKQLAEEASIYLKLLDGPEYATADYVRTHAGKKALGGYKNKIRRSPRLARIAAINTLLQRTFYDLTKQKKPLENAGKWFHSSFDRYADPNRPMEITGEIVDWAKSPYTLQEIALVFARERKRQETQWWPPQSAHLPFSSCVVAYQHLPASSPGVRMKSAEEGQDIFPSETARPGAEGTTGLPFTQWMNRTEAEQLVDEISHEASWYLDRIHISPESRIGEHAYIVEAFIVETTFSVTYVSRQDWWQEHQQQLRHQTWKEKNRQKMQRGMLSLKETDNYREGTNILERKIG